MSDLQQLSGSAADIAKQVEQMAQQLQLLTKETMSPHMVANDPLVAGISLFVLACFVGYYVVWRVTPALHTPLMAVTNAISGIVIVGAMIAVGPEGIGGAQLLGWFAMLLATINIAGGFVVTQRMLQMFKKKAKS